MYVIADDPKAVELSAIGGSMPVLHSNKGTGPAELFQNPYSEPATVASAAAPSSVKTLANQ